MIIRRRTRGVPRADGSSPIRDRAAARSTKIPLRPEWYSPTDPALGRDTSVVVGGNAVGIEGGAIMELLRKLFGPSQDEIWRKLAAEIGAAFVDGGMWKGDEVRAQVGEWTVTLDTFTVSTGQSHVTFTRMRAPYVNPDGFRFAIYRKGFFSELGKTLGMQDLEVGIPDFDEAFIIKGNDENKVRALFGDPAVRELIAAQPEIHLEVKDDEGYFGPSFPATVDELVFKVMGVIRDVDRLKALFDLFAAVLHQLCHMGAAYESDPNLAL
jgi:hypothetical protein